MSGERWASGILCAAVLAVSAPARAFDPLRAETSIPAGPASPVISNPALCVFESVGQPLRLDEAVERALCTSPKTRQAWIDVKLRAAQVGQGRAAFLPTVSAQWQAVHDDSVTDITGHPDLSSANRSSIRSENISLSWVLYDFGGRSAALRNASELLNAAQASQEAQLQKNLSDVAHDYYGAQAAQGALEAADEVVGTARDSLAAATARAERGIVPGSDELQARTAYAQAVFNRTKAQGEWETAIGTLASDMNLAPDQPISLPSVAENVGPVDEFRDSVAALMDEARRTHPSVRAAQAELDAALAKTRQIRAQGLPTLSLTAKYSTNNQPATLGLGIPQFPATGHDWFIGFQISIPIFEGFSRVYQVREAEAQSEMQQAVLDEARRQVAIDVWNAYYALDAATRNVNNSATLLDAAALSYTAAERRYAKSVGGILELLSAQSDLANARKQRIQAITDWRNARLQLAAKLGHLGMWQLSEQ